MFGITLEAISGTSKQSMVAMNAISPATRVCTKVSLRALENAGTRTLRFVLYPSEGPSRPINMHVFVRIEGSVSVCALASNRSRSLLRMRSVSFVKRN